MPGHTFLEGTDVALRVMEQSDRDCAILGRVRNDPAFRHNLFFDTPWPRSRVHEFVDSTVVDESSINLFVCQGVEECCQDGREQSGEIDGEGPKNSVADIPITVSDAAATLTAG